MTNTTTRAKIETTEPVKPAPCAKCGSQWEFDMVWSEPRFDAPIFSRRKVWRFVHECAAAPVLA